MPDQEQPGTAEAAPASAPETTSDAPASPESQTAQPGETTKVESEPSTPQATNWDDPTNPWKQKYDGFVGNFKQLKDNHDQTQVQLRQLITEREQERQQQAWYAQQAEIAEKERHLASVVEQQDGDAALKEVANTLQQQRTAVQIQQAQLAQQQAQQQALQQYQGQVYQTFQRQYFDADVRVAKRSGLSDEEINGVLQTSKGYDDFHDTLIQRGVDKKMGNVEQLVQQKVDAALKAYRESDKASSRGAERSPDVSGGAPPRANDDSAFLEQFASGKSNDYKRAKTLLGL